MVTHLLKKPSNQLVTDILLYDELLVFNTLFYFVDVWTISDKQCVYVKLTTTLSVQLGVGLSKPMLILRVDIRLN